MGVYVVCIFSDAAQYMLLIMQGSIYVFVHNEGGVHCK